MNQKGASPNGQDQGVGGYSGADGAGAAGGQVPGTSISSSGANPGASSQGAAGSPDQAGTGFVNLSQLLALNGKSGQDSANSYAAQTRNAGTGASAQLAGLQGKFNQAMKDGTVDATDVENRVGGATGADGTPNAQKGYFQAAADKAGRGYAGPSSLEDMGGYQSVATQLAKAQSRAQNSQTSGGVAAQIAQDTGLSPRQAAASAFYMGVNNGDIKRSGSQFQNLTGMLGTANDQSMQESQEAQNYESESARQLAGDEKQVDSGWDQIDQNAKGQAAWNVAHPNGDADVPGNPTLDTSNDDPTFTPNASGQFKTNGGANGDPTIQNSDVGRTIDKRAWIAAGRPMNPDGSPNYDGFYTKQSQKY